MTQKSLQKPHMISTILVSSFILFTSPAFAEAPKDISQHKDWSVFEYQENGKKDCFAVSIPTESLPKGVRRGGIYFSVTHSQSDKTTNAVSISMGYPLKAGSNPTATIGSTVYQFFAQGETIWPISDTVLAKLVAGMKRGQKVVIRGTSSRGTKTTDTFSLSGVTAAIAAAKKNCGM